MKMNKRKGLLLTAAGIVLLAVAVGLLGFRILTENRSNIRNKEAVEYLQQVLPGKEAGLKDGRANRAMASAAYDGRDYVAILEIPAFGRALPVSMSWDKKLVQTVPCRFTGNPYDGSLVIGGTPGSGQFDFISLMDIGDEVTLTDMDGCVFRYKVKTVKHAKNALAETLTGGDCDLTLFAKQEKLGREYLLVRCVME